MPVAHSFAQVREDVLRVMAGIADEDLWTEPGGAASVGFHLMHLAGSTERLFTYARGETLNARQLETLKAERSLAASRPSGSQVKAAALAAIDEALEALHAVSGDRLQDPRVVGRAGLPSTVGGLLFHAAEHATRHVGQALTTAKIVGAAPQP